jgi:sphingomyelin phosphodiesterase acid-like 3
MMPRLRNFLVSGLCAMIPLSGFAQARDAASPATLNALLVSDIHFEPFWDPAKAVQLAAAPVEQWDAIFAAPDSPDRARRFAALQKECHARGNDTSYSLLESSLKAMRAHASGARFITLSGDLMAHQFSCKLQAAIPNRTPAQYRSFAAKTVAFVLARLRRAFPGVPVYTALGNNDSDCGDYQQDAGSPFLAAAGKAIAAGLPPAERSGVERMFAADGDFGAPLPEPIRGARILVLDDVFMAAKYATCAGKPDSDPAADQIAWLRRQLDAARRQHLKVWVMAHLPPGINAYAAVRNLRNVCGGESADTFLASNALAATLSEYGDVVRLAIFGHTHMDEVRLIVPAGGDSAKHPAIAARIVGSISPVDGNDPSFTVAQIDPETATMIDDQVYAASDASGSTWAEEYDFARAYHEPAFTGSAVSALIARFQADPRAQSPESEDYLSNYFVGGRALELKAFWPAYVCSLANLTPASYRGCVCSGKH